MKKQFFKLVSVVIVLLCASISMSAAVDWSNYAFIGDGTGSGKYANKYKVETVEGLNVVNIQKPGFANEDGIYVTVPARISECSVASAIQSAGVVIYLSGLTAQENEVTIKYAPSKEITFHIYYADGSSGTKQASDLTLTKPATTILDLQIGDDFTIKYTTSSRGAVTFSSSNTDVATVSADSVITALAAGTTTITVSQAEDETYNAGSKSFTLSVIEVYGGQCTFSGKAGDGQSHDKGTSLFTKGYNISLYLNSRKDTIFVKAAFLDDETATSALFQNYPQRDEKVEVKEWRFNREGETQVFSGKVPVSELSNKADGIIRFGIKFEFDGGLRVTTPQFYYLDGSGCAERDFVIYHHDQTPEDPERDAPVYTFKGGRILQPIVYKRKLKPGIWETLSLPFDVSKITVSEGEVEYELHAQYTDNNNTTHEGEFWLRDFREKEVSAEEFQANWHDIQDTTAALPKKNVPYIIRVPDDNTHYWADKYIVFHGASYQTIDSVYSPNVQVPEAENMFAYSGNNTMKEWKLRSAYVLDNEGIYFESGETVTLYPFECAVNAKIETTRAMPRLALNRKTEVPTGNLPPTTAVEPGNVWSVTGWYVGSFCDSNQYDRLMQRLPAGMYVVRQAETTYKVYIAK